MRRRYDFKDFPAERVLAAKRGRRVSVCLPARNEVVTVGATVATIQRELVVKVPVVDEILVIDDGSTDGTAGAAGAAGATVLSAEDLLTEYGPGPGKGQAMWKGVHASTGDVVAFCDADISNFEAGFILGVVGPLLTRDDVEFVKGFYDRPLQGAVGQGGRVTELMARPLISILFPHLADLDQPLAGEFAAHREVLESVPFACGYGVDLALLIDVTAKFGNHALVQSDLGIRVHRNRPLTDLGPQALSILQLALHRAGVTPGDPEFSWTNTLIRPGLDPRTETFGERPPLVEVPSHRKTA